MAKDILVKNVDTRLLKQQYDELVLIIEDNPSSIIWGMVDMIGDMLDEEA